MAKCTFFICLTAWHRDPLDPDKQRRTDYWLTKIVELPFRPSIDYDYELAGGAKMNTHQVLYHIEEDQWTIHGNCWVDAQTANDALALMYARGWAISDKN